MDNSAGILLGLVISTLIGPLTSSVSVFRIAIISVNRAHPILKTENTVVIHAPSLVTPHELLNVWQENYFPSYMVSCERSSTHTEQMPCTYCFKSLGEEVAR